MVTQKVCRIGDRANPHGPGPHAGPVATSGSDDVFADSIKVHRVGDSWSCSATLKSGSTTVYVNSKQLGRIGDPLTCQYAYVITGSSTVFAGG